MSLLSKIIRELLGLFVDDVPYTGAIIVWIVAAGMGLPELAIDIAWDAPLLAAGCALVLMGGTFWAAVKHRRQCEATSQPERGQTR